MQLDLVLREVFGEDSKGWWFMDLCEDGFLALGDVYFYSQ